MFNKELVRSAGFEAAKFGARSFLWNHVKSIFALALLLGVILGGSLHIISGIEKVFDSLDKVMMEYKNDSPVYNSLKKAVPGSRDLVIAIETRYVFIGDVSQFFRGIITAVSGHDINLNFVGYGEFMNWLDLESKRLENGDLNSFDYIDEAYVNYVSELN